MTQKQIRQIARETLAAFLKGDFNDVARRDAAIAVLNAPHYKGE
jgi:hypothetical protein